MDVYATEEEQIAKIKEWLKNYGLTIFIGVLIAIGGTYGWRYWHGHQEKKFACKPPLAMKKC